MMRHPPAASPVAEAADPDIGIALTICGPQGFPLTDPLNLLLRSGHVNQHERIDLSLRVVHGDGQPDPDGTRTTVRPRCALRRVPSSKCTLFHCSPCKTMPHKAGVVMTHRLATRKISGVRPGLRWIAVFIVGLLLCLPQVSRAENSASVSRHPRVLVLYSNERLLPANIAVDEAIRATFQTELQEPVEFYTEFLDVDRFPGEARQVRMSDYMRDKYRDRPPDIVIAGGASALNFLMLQRLLLSWGVPIVHCGVVPREIPNTVFDDRVVGIPHRVDTMATIELALQLQPETRQVAIVDGMEKGGLTPAEVSLLATKVGLLWLTNRSISELRDTLSRLPEHSVVFYGTMFHDTEGNVFTPRAALDQIAPTSRVPIYGNYDTYLGHGIVGGSIVSFESVGRGAAQIAIRILKGQTPQEAARGVSHTPTPMFDWRQLQRWSIPESRLPHESAVYFRPPSLWEENKWAIMSGIGLLLLEAGLILGLIIQLRRRRRAEVMARYSEQEARELSGRLIHTQEEERRRIARDLHDDFNQRLALLSVEMDLLGQMPSNPEAAVQIQKLGELVRELATDVHRLAYQLHPAMLEQMGLVAAVGGLCQDLSQKSCLKVDFSHDNIPRDLSDDVSRCAFRVIQECLQNVMRHSGAKEARVELAAKNGHLHLLVSDSGKGFDLELSRQAAGLGLMGMRERVRLSQGELEIRSAPGEGTQVELTIPLRKKKITS